MAKEKEKEANATEHQSKPLLISDRTGQALKPKPKILKKSSHKNLTKVDKSKVTNQRSGKKKKTMVSESKVEKDSIDKEDEKKRNSSETKQKSIEEHNDKSQQSQKIKENLGALQRKKENKKKNKKRSGLEKLKSRKDKEKYAELEMNQRKEKKMEKLGGLIFMCSAKTKPDCFHYGVMGVPMSKKELVMSVKPGLKLFLYDFELRLMYGIYKASSSGGVKLEPTAFNGAFPIQVRFGVQEDCYPLPENVFRKAIKDNYNENQKFDTQLSVKQVKKLIELFQPVELRSKSLAIDPQPIVSVQNGEVVEKARKSRQHSYNESSLHSYDKVRRYAVRPYEDHQRIPCREVPLTEKDELHQNTFLTEKEYRTYSLRGERPKPSQLFAIDPHTHNEFGRCYLLPHEDNRHIPYKEVSLTQNNDLRHDTFLTEKEYRTYGLRRERPNLTPPKLEAFPKSYVREDLLRQPSFIYRDVAPQQGEPSRHHPLLMNERECQDYGIGTNQELRQLIPSVTAAADSTLDSYPRYQHYSSHYGTSSMDPYAPISRRDEVLPSSHTLSRNRETYPVEMVHLPGKGIYVTETNHLSRRGIYPTDIDPSRRKNDDVERLYSTYASRELSDYNRNHNYKGQCLNPPMHQFHHDTLLLGHHCHISDPILHHCPLFCVFSSSLALHQVGSQTSAKMAQLQVRR